MLEFDLLAKYYQKLKFNGKTNFYNLQKFTIIWSNVTLLVTSYYHTICYYIDYCTTTN